MRVAFLEIRSDRPECINKDFMGGFGWAFHIGSSYRARAIERVKKSGESVPLVEAAYLAAIFLQAGHAVSVVRNRVPDADLVFMHASMVDYRHELEWLRRVRHERPGATIGVLGPFATFRPELFEPDCDFIVRGEPEGLALELAAGLRPLPRGVVDASPIADLDALPFPAWNLFDVEEYSYFPALRETPFLVVLSSRGCVYRCGYCPYPVNYPWAQRSVDNVLDEIGWNIDTYGMRAFLFRDPLFSAKPERARELAEGMIRRGFRVKWACETRFDLLDTDLLDLLHRAGLRVINVGVESSDDELLRGVDRVPIERAHQRRVVRHCERIGIRVCAFYVLGLPGDSARSIRATIEYAKQLNTHAAMFYLATPFPGTALYEQLQDQLIVDRFEDMDCFTPVVHNPLLTPAELSGLLEYAYVSYYYRPRWAAALVRRAWRDLWDRQVGA